MSDLETCDSMFQSVLLGQSWHLQSPEILSAHFPAITHLDYLTEVLTVSSVSSPAQTDVQETYIHICCLAEVSVTGLRSAQWAIKGPNQKKTDASLFLCVYVFHKGSIKIPRVYIRLNFTLLSSISYGRSQPPCRSRIWLTGGIILYPNCLMADQRICLFHVAPLPYFTFAPRTEVQATLQRGKSNCGLAAWEPQNFLHTFLDKKKKRDERYHPFTLCFFYTGGKSTCAPSRPRSVFRETFRHRHWHDSGD